MASRKTGGLVARLRQIGPAAVVTAAFIGPGTVTTCTLAGVQYRYALLWAMVFATVATIVMQEMSARIGIVTGKGLGEAIRETFIERPGFRLLACALIVAAIGIGNAAFQVGNLTGASLGLEVLLGGERRLWLGALAVAASALLWSGSYKIIEKILMALVALMCLLFVATAVVVQPNWGEVFRGAFVPGIPPAALLVTVGLIGTTVVPYNLFLHSSAAAEKWGSVSDKKEMVSASRFDTVLDISVGGIISIAIIITAAAMFGTGVVIRGAADMARQLEPLLGPWAKWTFALGLWAAGFTSAIAAPLAASYAIIGVIGRKTTMKGRDFRGIWIAVMAIATGITLAGVSPVEMIVFAQAVNGVLLPISTIYLLIVMNQSRIMKGFTNNLTQNILGGAVTIVSVVLGLRLVLRAFGII